jgi:hypothetical protein
MKVMGMLWLDVWMSDPLLVLPNRMGRARAIVVSDPSKLADSTGVVYGSHTVSIDTVDCSDRPNQMYRPCSCTCWSCLP